MTREHTSCAFSSIRHEFPPTELASNPNPSHLAILITLIPLSNCGHILPVRSGLRHTWSTVIFDITLSKNLDDSLPPAAGTMKMTGNHSQFDSSMPFSQVCVSSAMGSYHVAMMGNLGHWQYFVLCWEPLWPLWPITYTICLELSFLFNDA